jgi:hypothetical protein
VKVKLGLGVAVCVLLVGAYFLGTVSAKRVVSAPPAEWAEGSASATAWRELAISLEAAGEHVFSSTPDPGERREGLAFLADLLSAALEMKVAKGDVRQPRFTDWMSDHRKFLGDTPDAVYHTAELSAEHGYEIRGTRNDAEYLGFMLYGRGLNGWNRAAGNVSSETMRFDDEGRFRLLLSRERPELDERADWIALEDDVHMVMVRQYFHDRATKREARFTIRNLEPVAPTPKEDAQLAASLREATAFFTGTLHGTVALAQMVAKKPNTEEPPSEYNADFGGIFYPTSDNQYLGTGFALAEGEALIVEGVVPNVDYWSVSLQNSWLQSIESAHHTSSLHNHQIEQRNGRYRVVVSASDPGVENWLDTAGHREGLLAVRYQLAEAFEPPTIRLVKTSEILAASSQGAQ